LAGIKGRRDIDEVAEMKNDTTEEGDDTALFAPYQPRRETGSDADPRRTGPVEYGAETAERKGGQSENLDPQPNYSENNLWWRLAP